MKNTRKKRWKMAFRATFIAILIGFQFLLAQRAFAIAVPVPIPSTVEPAQVSRAIASQRPSFISPGTLPALPSLTEPAQGLLGPEAKRIQFKLTQIVLEGNHVYSDQQLRALFQNKLNTTITVAELQGIVQDITNYYRNNGYILTRAILPPQHIAKGIVHVRVIEGYIGKVTVVGNPKGAKELIAAYGEKIRQSRPLQLKVMERYLLLANQIPGSQVKAVLEPSKTQIGASDLNLVAQQKTWNGFFQFNNYGTRYIGPNQLSAGLSMTSIFRSGDYSQVNFATTAKGNELKYWDTSYIMPLGCNGMTLILGTNYARTVPGFVLTILDVIGVTKTAYATVLYPLLRSRTDNITLDAGFRYLNSNVHELGLLFYNDHLRPVRFGAIYDFSDRFNGTNLVGAHVFHGLEILGATKSDTSLLTSRFGGRGDFTKFTLDLTRLQQLWWRFSLFLLATGQYACNPLLASEQFSYGGSNLGRGYDPSEIIGDLGAAGSAEFRVDLAPGLAFFQTAQFYWFYDMGKIWNRLNLPGQKKNQSATSTGVGGRFGFNRFLSGDLFIAQPLTRIVDANALTNHGRGNGRVPRVFFNLTASF